MMLKLETVYLQNPPVKEIQDYKQARAEYMALQNAQHSDVATEHALETNIQARADVTYDTNSPAYGAPGTAAANNNSLVLQQESVLTVSNMVSAHARTQSRDGQIEPLEKYLSTFPDKNVYWVDHFAIRTGKKINGLEVYDLGIAPGLTY